MVPLEAWDKSWTGRVEKESTAGRGRVAVRSLVEIRWRYSRYLLAVIAHRVGAYLVKTPHEVLSRGDDTLTTCDHKSRVS